MSASSTGKDVIPVIDNTKFDGASTTGYYVTQRYCRKLGELQTAVCSRLLSPKNMRLSFHILTYTPGRRYVQKKTGRRSKVFFKRKTKRLGKRNSPLFVIRVTIMLSADDLQRILVGINSFFASKSTVAQFCIIKLVILQIEALMSKSQARFTKNGTSRMSFAGGAQGTQCCFYYTTIVNSFYRLLIATMIHSMA